MPKTDDPKEHILCTPLWVPRLRMVACETKADFFVGLESSIWCQKNDIRGFERILMRKQDFPDINSTVVRRVKVIEHKISDQSILLCRFCDNIWDGIFLH